MKKKRNRKIKRPIGHPLGKKNRKKPVVKTGHFPPLRKADPIKVKALYLEGWGVVAISSHLILSRQTIWRYLNYPEKLTVEEEMEHLKNSKTVNKAI